MAKQQRLSPDTFLTTLTTLLSTTHTTGYGSIYLTQKPMPPSPSTPSPSPPQILIRATNGASPRKQHSPTGAKVQKKDPSAREKIKISTVVEVAELEGFYAKYAEVCKKGMEGLRKRDKKKAKEKAKKKKGKGGAGS